MLRWREYVMELTRQWCDTKTCPDCGTVEAGNIKVFSYVEHRYSCTTCRHTLSADKHTCFETERRPRLMAVEALALLGERNSLRAGARLTPHSPHRILHLCQKKQAHRQPDDPTDVGDMWVGRALALPSRLRVLSHLSHERSAAEATMFLATCKARTDGDAPFFTSDQLPAYVAALIANDSTPEPPPRTRGPGRPRKAPKRVV